MHARRQPPLLAAAALLVAGCRAGVPDGRVVVRGPAEVEFGATVHPGTFDSGWMMPGYHAVVWERGRMAHAALLRADVSDLQVLRALESLGAKPGNNLVMEAWRERRNPDRPEPDGIIAGPDVEVLLRIPGRAALVRLSDVLLDPGGRGIAMRFGGNEANIPRWKSGCIVCLYSCPGSKVGNARYTERDYARDVTRFRVRPGSLPPAGARVSVVLRLARPGDRRGG